MHQFISVVPHLLASARRWGGEKMNNVAIYTIGILLQATLLLLVSAYLHAPLVVAASSPSFVDVFSHLYHHHHHRLSSPSSSASIIKSRITFNNVAYRQEGGGTRRSAAAFLSSLFASSKSAHQHDSKIMEEDNHNTQPYLLDEYGRPTSIHQNSKLMVLQTPHSGRKFRQTRPELLTDGSGDDGDGSMRSRLRSRITQLLHHTWRRRHPRKQRRQRRSSRRHAITNRRRFTEGWYYRLTLPAYNESFVFIFSIEDAGRILPNGTKSPLTLACMQLLGPKDTYLVQADDDDQKFWGWKHAQALGCTFEWKEDYLAMIDGNANNNDSEDGGGVRTSSTKDYIAAMTPEEWREAVSSGFQILPFHFQGRLNGHDGTLGGVRANQGVPGWAEYDFSVRHVAGWGDYPPLLLNSTTTCTFDDDDASSKNRWRSNHANNTNRNNKYRQYSTAGWLASFPVFEPHWQITMAHARASGSVNWNGTTYEFEDAPFYGEKNWGGAFPTKWYWAQCNSFADYPDLALTAGGGIRQLPFSLPGKRTETLGLIGIHYDGRFFEIVPWTGEMAWNVWPWGRWEFIGRCTDVPKGKCRFEAEIIAVTDEDVPGVLLRAPTKEEGMQYFCRDSGFGNVVLSLWELEYDDITGDFIRSRTIIDKARSSQCTVEVGGGPWWDVWRVQSKMSSTLKRIIRLPLILRKACDW